MSERGRYFANLSRPEVTLHMDGARANMLAEILEGHRDESRAAVEKLGPGPDSQCARDWLSLSEGLLAELCPQLGVDGFRNAVVALRIIAAGAPDAVKQAQRALSQLGDADGAEAHWAQIVAQDKEDYGHLWPEEPS